jgi:hypothetical protein
LRTALIVIREQLHQMSETDFHKSGRSYQRIRTFLVSPPNPKHNCPTASTVLSGFHNVLSSMLQRRSPYVIISILDSYSFLQELHLEFIPSTALISWQMKGRQLEKKPLCMVVKYILHIHLMVLNPKESSYLSLTRSAGNS